MDYRRPPERDSWFAPLSVDLVHKVLMKTFLHPFICWLIPLCFRAETMEWDAPPMLVVIAWATFITLCWMASMINKRITFGLPREVDLSEEVIVITGGASGLGLLIAEVYGMRGATVAVLDIKDMENGEARGVTVYKCDVKDKAQLAQAAKDIERDVSADPKSSCNPFLLCYGDTGADRTQLGPPTVLINNAAVVVGKSLLDMDLSELDDSITTNLLGYFYALKAFLPAMVRSENGATVVTVSSVIGHLGAAKLTDYAAAKAGVTAMHKSLTAELRESHPEVRTVLVEPGQLSTPLFYGVQTPNSFLAPVVEPVDVAKEIIAAIDEGHSGHVAAPLYARWIDYYNILPTSLQVLVRRLAGVDTAMRTFVGRSGRQAVGKAESLI